LLLALTGKGGPENPISEIGLEEKFRACAELSLPQEKISKALDLLKGIEQLRDIRLLISALSLG